MGAPVRFADNMPGLAAPKIRSANLSRQFTSKGGTFTAIDKLSLDIAPGTFFVIVGPSGCGKTTLAELEKPSSGTVAVGLRTEQALARCDEVVLLGRRGGGELADGYFLSPTLVAERDCSGMSAHAEIYGPFISIVPFEEEGGAVACANAMRMARSVSIWTGDAGRARRLARALRNDSILVNRHDWLAPGGMHPGHAARGALSDFLIAPGRWQGAVAADRATLAGPLPGRAPDAAAAAL